jgi:hypothetical protein
VINLRTTRKRPTGSGIGEGTSAPAAGFSPYCPVGIRFHPPPPGPYQRVSQPVGSRAAVAGLAVVLSDADTDDPYRRVSSKSRSQPNHGRLYADAVTYPAFRADTNTATSGLPTEHSR